MAKRVSPATPTTAFCSSSMKPAGTLASHIEPIAPSQLPLPLCLRRTDGPMKEDNKEVQQLMESTGRTLQENAEDYAYAVLHPLHPLPTC